MFADAANASALDLTDELGGLERRLLLTQLVTKWAASQAIRREGNAPLVANNPASALALADALARLMDDMTTRQVPWDKLDTLVPGEHDEYWQLTLRFLNEIVRERLAGDPRRARQDRARRAARPADRRRGQAARRAHQRPRDRGRLHRLDAGDRDPDRDDREASAWRGGAARPRHRSRRGGLGRYRRPARRRRTRRSSRPPSAIRNSPCRRCCGGSASRATRSAGSANRRRMAARPSCRR